MFFPMQRDYLLGVGQSAMTKSILMALLGRRRLYKRNENNNRGEELTRSGFLWVLILGKASPRLLGCRLTRGFLT